MTSLSKEVTQKDTVAAIRGRMVSLTVLEVFAAELGQIKRQLEEKAAQAPEFFRNAPLLLDLSYLRAEVGFAWFDNVYRLLIDSHFIPVGITGASKSLENAANVRNIAIWPSVGKARYMVEEGERKADKQQVKSAQPNQEPPAITENSEPAYAETLVIRKQVRSGQKIYAKGGDLLVLASVSTGAEILADGHIHVYGTLRGRALAGVQGRDGARIFCSDLQADLVAIAGYYVISEDLPKDKRNTAVQIYLNEERLMIESL